MTTPRLGLSKFRRVSVLVLLSELVCCAALRRSMLNAPVPARLWLADLSVPLKSFNRLSAI